MLSALEKIDREVQLRHSTNRTAGHFLQTTESESELYAWAQAKIYVLSDMFDPAHNAVDKYYLVNGSWAGSWGGLPRDVSIVNWNHGGRAKSPPFFARRGHHQILAG